MGGGKKKGSKPRKPPPQKQVLASFGGRIRNRACLIDLQVTRIAVGEKGELTLDHEHEAVASCLIDTGAQGSVISPDFAKKLGLRQVGWASITSVTEQNKRVPAVIAHIQLLDKSGQYSGNIHLAVAPITEDMIFGMDLMDGGYLTVNLRDRTWKWSLMNRRMK